LTLILLLLLVAAIGHAASEMAFMQEIQGLLSGMAAEAAKLRTQVDSLTQDKEMCVVLVFLDHPCHTTYNLPFLACSPLLAPPRPAPPRLNEQLDILTDELSETKAALAERDEQLEEAKYMAKIHALEAAAPVRLALSSIHLKPARLPLRSFFPSVSHIALPTFLLPPPRPVFCARRTEAVDSRDRRARIRG
jgi:hypothetical protein